MIHENAGGVSFVFARKFLCRLGGVGRGLLAVLALSFGPTLLSKPRVIVSTDIGGSDPDDYQSMVHYLVYSDCFDTEGLISSPPHEGRVDNILECIDAYALDYPKLRRHSSAFPTPEALRAVTWQGAIEAQTGALPEAASAGARLIVERAKADDPRPLYVLVWGSITDVAQALHADPSIAPKLRVYSIGSWNTRQDELSRAYVYENYKDLWWIENDTTFRGMYMEGEQDGALGNLGFTERHVGGHGALGELFMAQMPKIKMGDTPSVLYLLHGDPDRPEGESWGGAFVQPDPSGRPLYWTDDPDPSLSVGDKLGARTVNRWREGYLGDWERRMDWAKGD